jgi:hypothetical protein
LEIPEISESILDLSPIEDEGVESRESREATWTRENVIVLECFLWSVVECEKGEGCAESKDSAVPGRVLSCHEMDVE